MSRDNFNARRAAMDKKLADSYRPLDDHNLPKKIYDLRLAMKKWFDELAQLINTQRHCSKSHSSRSSSRSNHGGNHECNRQPTLKSMVQTNNDILIPYVRGRNLSHARMRATYIFRARVIHHMR
jgi:hypothetical protein